MTDLTETSIIEWIKKYQIKTENGDLLDFKKHAFLRDPYLDAKPKQAIMKAAQIGFSTLGINKVIWMAKKVGMNIIYTLPTESDRNDFVSSKVNKIVSQNPIYSSWIKDKDAVEQKQVGEFTIFFRGTWSKKAAIMVSSDLNVYDEIDASKQDIIEQYSTRLQHSNMKWEWYFSHPSAKGYGIDRLWELSDQKYWFIECPHCKKEWYLNWPESIDREKGIFICQFCKQEIKDRSKGRWVNKQPKTKSFSGYWIPLLICPWVSATEIIKYYNEKSEEYFYNKVLGLPYVGGGNKLTRDKLMKNLTPNVITPDRDERVVIGVDTGKELHYVVGTSRGIFYYGTAKDYNELEGMMSRWPRAVAVIDQGGDLIGSRKFREKYLGRVYLCSTGGEKKGIELTAWGKNEESGSVQADRNRVIQLLVDEFSEGRIPLQGDENDWHDYWVHWDALTRIKEVDDKTGEIKRKIWVRSGADHWALATVYWRVGMSRFSSKGEIIGGDFGGMANYSPEISVDNTMENPKRLIMPASSADWRDI